MKNINKNKKKIKKIEIKDETLVSKPKKINKIKILVVILIFLSIAIYLSNSVYKLFKNPTDIVVVKQGTISQEETASGYIIRDEVILKGENYKNGMVQIKNEGERVANGDPVFRYYSSREETLKQQIAELDIKIQKAMEENEQSIFSADTKLIDKQIEEKLQKIEGINNIQEIKEYKEKISEYITKKAKIAGELSPSGSYLKNLIQERSTLENELNSGAEYVNATKSGMVSYKIDGLEEVLNNNDFSKINSEFLKNLNLKNGKIISTSNESGKIVNNFICYIAFILNSEEAYNAEIGNEVKIALPSTKQVKAKVEYITKEEDDVVIIFSINEGIEELLNFRKTSFDIIWWEAEGYKIPNECLIDENGINFVIRNKSGYLDKVLVKVKKQTEKYVIVTNYSTSEIKELNLDTTFSTSIMLYDEIILKPTTEQINKTT